MTNCLAQICSRTKNAQNLLKSILIDISNMPLLILKSKINFLKYLLSKLAPKLKMLRIYWSLTCVIIQICRFRFKCQKNYEIFTTCKAQISPKIDNALNLLKFGTHDILNILISIWMSKIQISINSEHFSFWEQFGPSNWSIVNKK